jgi:glutamine synthetase
MIAAPRFSEKEEVVKFVSENNVKIINFCHVPEDGRLKALSFSTVDKNRILEILESGERVDGSSLFSFIDPHKSDIYVMPKLGRVFLNPFSTTPTLNVLCKYLDEDGNPLDVAPENVLSRAEDRLCTATGVVLKVLAELEFFIISMRQESEALFPSIPDENYHESAPFSKFEHVRNEILVALSEVGIKTKYGHSEVGKLVGKDGEVMEQHEIEFMPQSMVEMAETISIAKWVIRNICARHGVSASFSPKISLEHAGNGMHIHLCGLRNGKNIVEDPSGDLSVEAKEMIGGILKFALSLAAFGNPTPISYLRFLGPKESPMNISWGARNRLALIRIPLWWNFKGVMAEADSCRRTFEYRAPDATANAYLLFAGMATAIKHGLKNHEESLKMAEDFHVEETAKRRRLKRLPLSCSESARNLRKERKCYEEEDVFPKAVIDRTIEKLRSYKDADLAQKLKDEPQKIERMIQSYLHYG